MNFASLQGSGCAWVLALVRSRFLEGFSVIGSACLKFGDEVDGGPCMAVELLRVKPNVSCATSDRNAFEEVKVKSLRVLPEALGF